MTRLTRIKPHLSFKAPLIFCSVMVLSAQAAAAPTANPDTYFVEVNQTKTLKPLSNDLGQRLFIEAVDQPSPYGTGTTIFTGSTITYTPPTGFTGSTKFWYGIKDANGDITSAPITMNVSGSVSSAWPTAGHDRATTQQGTAITIDPLWNDTGDQLRITDVNATSTQGSKIEIVNNQLFYTPSEWAKEGDNFWYVITDSQGRTNAARVTVRVGHSVNIGPWPTAGADSYTVNKNSSGNVLNIFSNDTGSGLEIEKLYDYTQESGRTFDTNGTVTYTPLPGFTGVDEFWYSMKDVHGRTNAAKVSLTVVNVDTGPNNVPDAREDSYSALINTGERTLEVLANDIDEDGDSLTITNLENAIYGSVRLTAGGAVRYTPPTSPISDSFKYTISDGNGSTASAVATISVTDPDDDNDYFPTITGEAITVSPGETVVLRVLDNDFDTDGDTLILDQVTSGSQGSTTKTADNNGNLNWVEYEALSTATGTDEFWYGVRDGRGKNGAGKVSVTFR